jgi:hypothetical protein
MTIPAAVRTLLEARERDLLDDPDLDGLIAETVADLAQTLLDQTLLDIDELVEIPEIIDPLGGPAYVRAVLEWRAAARAWARRRGRTGPAPVPPAVPRETD